MALRPLPAPQGQRPTTVPALLRLPGRCLMNADDPRHGTSAGYQRHRKDKEAACGPCREAQAEKMRRLRKDPVTRLKAGAVSKAGSRAAWRVVANHRAEYDRYYAEELAGLRRAPEGKSA